LDSTFNRKHYELPIINYAIHQTKLSIRQELAARLLMGAKRQLVEQHKPPLAIRPQSSAQARYTPPFQLFLAFPPPKTDKNGKRAKILNLQLAHFHLAHHTQSYPTPEL
jgi:hypothetical protein